MIIDQFLEIESFLTPKAYEIERLQVVSRQGWNAPWMELFEAHQHCHIGHCQFLEIESFSRTLTWTRRIMVRPVFNYVVHSISSFHIISLFHHFIISLFHHFIISSFHHFIILVYKLIGLWSSPTLLPEVRTSSFHNWSPSVLRLQVVVPAGLKWPSNRAVWSELTQSQWVLASFWK